MKQITSQKYVYKIDSKRLADSDYDLKLKSDKEEIAMNNVIALGDNQVFRFLDDICKTGITHDIEHDKPISKNCYKDKLIEIVFDKVEHFDKCCKDGFKVNGKTYKRLLGTTGGVKKNTVIFCNEKYYDKLYKRIKCDRDESIPLVPSKIEAYMALSFSNSIEVTQPKKIAVLPDAISIVKEDVIYIDDKANEEHPPLEPIVEVKENYENEVNISDGCGLVDINLLKKWSKETQPAKKDINGNEYYDTLGGCCLRNAYLKGMVYPFDYRRWINEYNDGNSICKDVWGNDVDLKECDLILTEGMLKLWNCYDSIEDYIEKTIKNGFKFSVCKIVESHIEDRRRLNYQYLQSFELTDEEIKELSMDTVEDIKDCMGRNYEKTLKFLGIGKNVKKEKMKQFGYSEAVSLNKDLLNDKMFLKTLDKQLKKKINEAKIGRLYVNGNYQMASGDPVCILERAFNKEVKGFLKRREFFSTYWYNKNVDEVLIMRSPMTCHNNIIKGNISLDEELYSWYKDMKNVLIFNCHDNTMSAENGEDFDGDSNFTTNNDILLKAHKETLTTLCVQYKPKKYIITEELLADSNKKGFNNCVGNITNIATSMYDTIAKFEKGSRQYDELSKRILCTQLYQQEEIDRIKGSPYTTMNEEWTNYIPLQISVDKETGEVLDSENEIKRKDFYKEILTCKKPYFMKYIYSKLNATYNKHVKKFNEYCMYKNTIRAESIDELLLLENKTEEEEILCKKYINGFEVTDEKSTMNRICHKIEDEFIGCCMNIAKTKEKFDHNILKCNVEYTDEELKAIKYIYDDFASTSYIRMKTEHSEKHDKEEGIVFRDMFIEEYKERIEKTRIDKNKVCDIIIDLTYKNNKSSQFMWDMCGETIIDNLIERNDK